MSPSRSILLVLSLALIMAVSIACRIEAQGLPAEPQIEPPPIEEMSSEVPPDLVPGQGSRDDETEQPAPAGEPEPQAESEVAEADTIALFYLRRCSACHTIGRGDLDGPDLLRSTKWSREDLRVAIRRMEKNVGPMTEEQVEGLIDLLESDDLQDRLDDAATRRIAEMAATLDPGSPRNGRRLFFGETSFENGGIGCFACHAVGGRGGNLAIDLTLAHPRLGQSSLVSATEEPSFPLMKASYGAKPVSSQEALHIAAFLESVASEAKTAGVETVPPAEPVRMLHGVAGGIVLLSLGGIAFVARSRRAGARSRLVRDSFRR